MITPIEGIVQQGQGKGTQFGFPTANIFCDDKHLSGGTWRYNVIIEPEHNEQLPKDTQNLISHGEMLMFQALGPYFPEQNLLEAHLLGFQGDLYNKTITVYPLRKIRDNQKFSTLHELVAQIQQDKERVLSHPIKVITFGTFDKFHPGHQAYLSQARKWGDELITVVARDKTVQDIKGRQARQDEHTRLNKVQASGLVDEAVLGSLENHYDVFQHYQPHIVCLGYDQHSFEQGIVQYCVENNVRIPHIIRLEAYHPEKFKSSLIQK